MPIISIDKNCEVVMKKFIIIASIIILCSSCVTSTTSQRPQKWMGRNIDELVAEKGYPDETITAPNGNKVYVFHRSRDVVKTKEVFVPWHAREVKTQRWASHSYKTQQYCSFYIEVDKANTIVNLFKKGNHCK